MRPVAFEEPGIVCVTPYDKGGDRLGGGLCMSRNCIRRDGEDKAVEKVTDTYSAGPRGRLYSAMLLSFHGGGRQDDDAFE